MNYIENIFVCLVAPLLIAQICTRGKGKRMMLFLFSGMAVCLLSSYISTFMILLVFIPPTVAISLVVSLVVLACLLGMPGPAYASVGLADGTYTVEVSTQDAIGTIWIFAFPSDSVDYENMDADQIVDFLLGEIS